MPRSSLSKNISFLKKLKGKALIICVLHALRPLRAAGVVPDIVIHTDPQNLKAVHREENGKLQTVYDHWVKRGI